MVDPRRSPQRWMLLLLLLLVVVVLLLLLLIVFLWLHLCSSSCHYPIFDCLSSSSRYYRPLFWFSRRY